MFMTFEKENNVKTLTPFKERRTLATIDDYACRYKLSKVTIEEFRKMGLIQTRKFKGKTFIIDTPNLNFQTFQDASDDQDSTDTQPAATPGAVESIKDQIIALAKTDIKDIPALILNAWKTIAVSAVCFSVLLLGINSYTAKNYDIDSLSQANVGLRSALEKSMLQLRQTAPPQIELDAANAMILQLQNQLTQAQSQLSTLQKQFDFANQRLDYLQQRNYNASKQFDYLKSAANHSNEPVNP